MQICELAKKAVEDALRGTRAKQREDVWASTLRTIEDLLNFWPDLEQVGKLFRPLADCIVNLQSFR